MTRSLRFSPAASRRLAWAALAALVLIVFSGAGVRLSGSGLGCPDWPRCHGGFTPELDSHVAIEYGNRLLSSVVAFFSIAAGVAALRRRPFRRDLVVPAWALMGGVLAQGVLGGITVLLDLQWEVVIAHYLLSMALLVAGGAPGWWPARGACGVSARSPMRPRWRPSAVSGSRCAAWSPTAGW